MASPNNVSLPSIHEMFPTHFMRRDKLDAKHPSPHRTQFPTLTSPLPSLSIPHFSPAPSNSMCTISMGHRSSTSTSNTISSNSTIPFSTAASPQPSAGSRQPYPALQPHTFAAAHHPHARPRRGMAHALSSSANTSPYTPGPASASLSGSVSSAKSSAGGPPSGSLNPPEHLRSLTYQESHPQAPSRAQASPYYGRNRGYSYTPPSPSAHHQQPIDTSDGEDDDASEGGIDSSPMRMPQVVPVNLVPAHLGTPPASHAQGILVLSGNEHICPTCFKRFNRPSSLRIHSNTHTGATPFRCPWPDCAREFNVNSNMRRHYRHHFSTSASSSSSSNTPTSPNPPPTPVND